MNLTIKEISKLYRGGIWGLKQFSLTLEPGVLGLLGPNGAGKSTLMTIIATISQPTEGQILWNDIDISEKPNAIREVLGYLPQDFGVYPNLNAVEFLEYMAAIKGLDGVSARNRIRELLDLVHLGSEVRYRRLGGYSGGMRQRVGIAQALLNDPKLLIVDEPTAGLDPQERVRFRNLLADLSGDRIVILSTHIVNDIEAVATRIALINKGELLASTLPEELLQIVGGKVWELVVPSDELESLKQRSILCSSARRRDGNHVRVVADKAPAADSVPVDPTLEDAYLYFIENNRRETT